MALKARRAAVEGTRGRADDDYASAGTADEAYKITVEPGTTNTQMTAMADTVVKQAELSHLLMSKYVMVTLGKPHQGDPQATIALVWGREAATPVGADTYRDDGGEAPVQT